MFVLVVGSIGNSCIHASMHLDKLISMSQSLKKKSGHTSLGVQGYHGVGQSHTYVDMMSSCDL